MQTQLINHKSGKKYNVGDKIKWDNQFWYILGISRDNVEIEHVSGMRSYDLLLPQYFNCYINYYE